MVSPLNILVIKLSALGDFIISLGAMKAIRAHHPDAHITLLTTAAFENFAKKSGYFDKIYIDDRPKFYQLSKWFSLRKKLNNAKFDWVYDLQNNERTARYFQLLSPKPKWVGTAKGASHYFDPPERTAGLPLEGHRILLGHAGIKNISTDKMEWINTDIQKFNLQNPYALIVPGSAPSRPEKRWPKEKYAQLCISLIAKNITPVLLGTKDEQEITDFIASKCPQALNLTAKTSLFDIITLGKNAKYAIGNDTGPMHMIAPTGCNTLVLFSSHSNPIRNAPTGDMVKTIQVDDFNSLDVQHVLKTILE